MILLVHNIIDAATDLYHYHAFAEADDTDAGDGVDAYVDDDGDTTCLRGLEGLPCCVQGTRQHSQRCKGSARSEHHHVCWMVLIGPLLGYPL